MLSISSRGHVENSWIQHHLKRVFCWQFAHPFTREKHTSIPSVWQYLLLHLSSWLLLPIPWYSCPPSISRILWRIHSVSISCWPTAYRLISSWKMTGRCHTKKASQWVIHEKIIHINTILPNCGEVFYVHALLLHHPAISRISALSMASSSLAYPFMKQ